MYKTVTRLGAKTHNRQKQHQMGTLYVDGMMRYGVKWFSPLRNRFRHADRFGQLFNTGFPATSHQVRAPASLCFGGGGSCNCIVPVRGRYCLQRNAHPCARRSRPEPRYLHGLFVCRKSASGSRSRAGSRSRYTCKRHFDTTFAGHARPCWTDRASRRQNGSRRRLRR